jgi:hypothetical protein
MAELRIVWSDGLTLLTVGSAVICTLLAVACGVAGLCSGDGKRRSRKSSDGRTLLRAI